VEEDADGLLHDVAGHLVEHVIAGHLVFDQGVVLAVGLEADALAELFHVVDVVHPLAVDDLEDDDALEFADGFGFGEFGFLGFVEGDRLLLELLLEAVAGAFADAAAVDDLEGDGGQKELVELGQVPVIAVDVVADAGVDGGVDEVCDHLEDAVAHALAVEDLAALGVDDLTLFVHDLVVVEQVFADAEVVALDLLLGALDGLGQGLVGDLLVLGDVEGVEHGGHALRSEQAHEVVLEGDVEAGFAGVSLTSASASQLVVDAAGLVALGAHDLEAAGGPGLFIQLDIGASACHVGGDGDGAVAACLGDDLGLLLVELGIEDVVGDAGLLEHLGEFFGDLDRDGADQDGLALLVGLSDSLDDRAEFFSLGLVDGVLVVVADDGAVGRDLDDVHAVDIAELALLGQGGTGHAGLFIEFIEKVLEGDRRQGPALALDLDVFLGLDGLVEAVGIAAAGHDAAGELVDDQDLVVLDDVVVVAVHEVVGAQGQDDAVLDLQVLGIGQVLDAEEFLDLGDTLRGQVDQLVLLIDDKVAGLLLLDAHDGVDLGQVLDVLASLHLAGQMKRGKDVEDLSKIDAIMGIEQEETGDFIVNEKDKLVNLTAEGVSKVEKFFRIENLADPENLEIQHCIILALRAHNLMHRDHDYIVKDDQVLIVDEFTGRVMPGRRYSDGLHQAIEAKEHVKVKRESRTLATITFQNFFNKFDKKAGMTGTALTEEREFRDIYGMDVIEIPTNRPVIRHDDEDAVYKTKREKFRAVVEAVREAHEKGQPVLVGTITIQVSEELSKMFKKAGIPHNVLNAKFHEQEAEIVAEAGRHGAVTIATNMAGRGTDIKLDEEARAAGGLKIVGTERHESRRIDNQLRGRSGRQGDPGESRFYISLEDDLMRLFGSERMTAMFNALNIPEDQEITHKSLSKAIEGAQKKIEGNNFGIRKNLLDYDQVMNEQREIIYAQRREVLDGKSMRDSVFKMITDFVDATVDTCISDDIDSDDWNLTELNELLLPTIPLQVINRGRIRERTRDGLKQQLKEEAVALYESKEAEFPEAEAVRELERVVILKVVDRKWMDHIDDMEQLRQSIGLQAYGQHDPLVEYKMAGYDMFNEMTRNIMEETVRVLFHVKVEQKVEREEVAKATGTNKDETLQKQPKRRSDKKIYPNDPCPCGSGKKYKNCHGRPGMKL